MNKLWSEHDVTGEHTPKLLDIHLIREASPQSAGRRQFTGTPPIENMGVSRPFRLDSLYARGLGLIGCQLALFKNGAIAIGTFICATFLMILPCTAQEVSPFGISISTTKPDNAVYLAQPALLNQCKARIDQCKTAPCDLIFIGDTLTEKWFGVGQSVWLSNFAKRNALNFSVGGDHLCNVLWRLDNLDIKDLKPKVAVVMVGTNDIDSSRRDIAKGARLVIEKTMELYPGIKIIVMSIPPNMREYDKVVATDEILRSFADDSNIYYLDLIPLMPVMVVTTPDGKQQTTCKGLSSDHYNFDESGYQIWADALNPLLLKLLGPPPK